VTVENLAGFKPASTVPDEIAISGELQVGGLTLPPLGEAAAHPNAQIQRAITEHTLNFRIPAGLAIGATKLRIRAWTAKEIEAPPVGVKTRPTTWPTYHWVNWVEKAPFKVRYVRVTRAGTTLISDAAAREVILRAFDLFATPPTDIAPARVDVWNTSRDWDTRDGIVDLLDDLDDQHDCTLSEAIFPWEDDCPDADGAVWAGVASRSIWGGMAQGYRVFGTSRNTAVFSPDRLVAAHELGHTLALNHVDPHLPTANPFEEDSSFDTLPNNGMIAQGDAFDPAAGKTVRGTSDHGDFALYDVMSYAMFKWISLANRQRVFDKF
jgi:hypothetical protein